MQHTNKPAEDDPGDQIPGLHGGIECPQPALISIEDGSIHDDEGNE